MYTEGGSGDEDEDEDVDSLLCGPSSGLKRPEKSLPQSSAMNLIVETIERIEDRMIRFEGKLDVMYEVVKDVQRDQEQKGITEKATSNKSDEEELPSFEPPLKKKKPEILGIPFIEVKMAFEGKRQHIIFIFFSNILFCKSSNLCQEIQGTRAICDSGLPPV